MKNQFLLFALFLTFALQAQVAVFHPVHVPADQMEKFLEIETNYSQKTAKDAVAKGNLVWWSLMKLTNTSSDDPYNYMWVNVYKDIDAATSDAAGWWANSKAVVGIAPGMLYDGLQGIKSDRRYFYKMQHQRDSGKSGKYVIFNFATPKNIAGVLESEEKVIIPTFKKNMKKSGMTGWGSATKITPQGKDYSTYMTYDAFDTMANLMRHLSGDGEAIKGIQWDAVEPITFESRYVFEVVSSSDQ